MAAKRKKSITYYLLYVVLYLHALLPFQLLYVMSDILYWLAYHLVRYRRVHVRRNLKNAFPHKTIREVRKIEKAFYHHLCDYFVESVKMLHMTEKEAHERMKFEHTEIIDQWTKEGKSCLLCLGHYANWEWVTSIGLHLSPRAELGLIYKRLHSEAFDQLYLKIRSHFGAKPIEMKSAFRKMIRLKNEGKTMTVGFLADQRPSRKQDQYWTTFLNQDTPVQTGMGKIGAHLGMPVAYLDIIKIKRGYYTGKIEVLSTNASMERDYDIMERYMRKLEETVLKEPAYYLWSHNRWKFKKIEAVQ
ncbi:MAG: lysophospholipid acyltransferase family protein [Proteiniphilum sp.]|jgi:KDO2-lipid IV(A) lauroyltransferase|nr:lysophospholipid acyltransferase family protein [Proteiniphilum sp.]